MKAEKKGNIYYIALTLYWSCPKCFCLPSGITVTCYEVDISTPNYIDAETETQEVKETWLRPYNNTLANSNCLVLLKS